MNAQSNAMGEAVVSSARVSAETLPPKHPFLWSVRRELWENRSIYLAPLAVSGLIILGSLISTVRATQNAAFGFVTPSAHNGAPPVPDGIALHHIQPFNFAAFLLIDRKSTRLNSSHMSISYA